MRLLFTIFLSCLCFSRAEGGPPALGDLILKEIKCEFPTLCRAAGDTILYGLSIGTMMRGLYGVNPTTVQPNQDGKFINPVLLLHGSCHNESAWVEVAKVLRKANIPAFSLNLGSDIITKKELDSINSKWESIYAIYEKAGAPIEKLRIHIIAHSRGGIVAQYIYRNSRIEIDEYGRECHISGYGNRLMGDIILMGTLDFANPRRKNTYALVAENDVLIEGNPHIHMHHLQVITFPTGHVGLLYDPGVLEWLNAWAQKNNT